MSLTPESSYRYKDTTYTCKDCLISLDSYRGHHNYGLKYTYMHVQTHLADGRTFGLGIQDGIGATQYKGKDRATEDHANIDGKVYKLGQPTFTTLDMEYFMGESASDA
jgi:hypothetical protein